MEVAKKISILSVTLFSYALCFTQRNEIDSLQKTLPLLKDTTRIDCLNALSYQYIRLLIRDSAEYYEKTAYNESQKLNYVHGIAESISNRSGIYDFFDNDFIKAEALARESLEWFEKTNNKNGIENANVNLIFAVFSQSKYDEANTIALKQYEIAKMQNDPSKMINALQGLGTIQYQEGNYDSAFYFYQQAQQLAIANKNNVEVSNILHGFGTLYREIGDYEVAINDYREVFQTDTRETIQSRTDASNETWTRMEYAELFSLTNQFDSAWHYYNLFDTAKITDKDLCIYIVSIGETYLLQGNYIMALQNLLRGLAIHKKLNDKNEIKRTLLDIAKTYFALGNNSLALQYAKEGLEMSLQTKSRQFIRNGYQILYLVYNRLHKTDSAYFYYQKYITIKDSVVSDQTKGRYAAYKYEQLITSANSEKLIAQQQLKEEAFQKKILSAGIIIILILAVIIYRNTALKRKSEKQQLVHAIEIQKLESEKRQTALQQQATDLELQALRSQMNPHFIFNCLNSINRFIINNDAAKAADYLTKFAKLIRIVLEQSGKSFVPLEDELKCLQLYMDLESLRFEIPFQYEINCNGTDISSVMIPTLLIQPFVENAIWHGLQGKNEGAGKIDINMSVKDDTLYCTVCDNGIGRSATIVKEKTETGKKSLGINLTEHRLQLIDPFQKEKTGIEIHDLRNDAGNNTGTCVDIKIPVKTI